MSGISLLLILLAFLAAASEEIASSTALFRVRVSSDNQTVNHSQIDRREHRPGQVGAKVTVWQSLWKPAGRVEEGSSRHHRSCYQHS